MGQKVNPTSLRLHPENKHFDSCWFSEKEYAHSVHKDLNIETYCNAILKQIQYPSASFFLEAAPRKCKVSVLFLNPAQLREQAFKQFDNKKRNSRSRKAKQSTLFSTKKESTLLYGLSKKRGGVLELLPASLFTPSFLQNLKNKDLFLDLLFNVFDPFVSSVFDTVKNKRVKNTLNTLNTLNTKKTISSLESGKKDEERAQKREDRAPPLLGEIKNKSFSSGANLGFANHRTLQEGRPTLKKQGMVDRQTDLHSKPFIRREAHTFGEEAKKRVWSNVVGLAISRYFVERKRSENLLSATSRFLLLQAFFCFLNLQKKGDSSDVFNVFDPFVFSVFDTVKSKRVKNTLNTLNTKNSKNIEGERFSTFFFDKKKPLFPLEKQDVPPFPEQAVLLAKTRVEFQEDQKNARSLLYKSDLQSKAKGKKRQESGLFSNLQKSSIYAYHIESIISNRLKGSCRISFFRAQNVAQNALFVAEEIVYQLERRNTFRQIKSKFLQELGNKSAIKGVRVTCVGRIGGRAKKAQRARGESFKMGQTSLHLFNSKVSFASKTALTPFGAVGVKVWICWK